MNNLKGLDSSYTNRFESLIDVDFLKPHWNYFTPCSNIYDKRIENYNPKFLKSLFEDQSLIISSMIPPNIENFASHLYDTYFPSTSFPNLQYEYTKQKADLPEILKSINTISIDMENPTNDFSLIPSIINTEKEGLRNSLQELIENYVNLLTGSSCFDKTIEKVLSLAELNQRLTFNSRDAEVRTDDDILSNIQYDYWGTWGAELALLHVDILDGLEQLNNPISNKLVTLATILLGLIEFILAYDLMEQAIQLDPSTAGVNEEYKQKMKVRAYYALDDSIRRIVYGGVELVFEVFIEDDTAADAVSFVCMAYDLLLDLETPVPYYLDITEQSAIDLFNFEKGINIIMGMATALTTICAQKVHIYAGLACFTVANICLTIRGMKAAYLFDDMFMYQLILILGILDI